MNSSIKIKPTQEEKDIEKCALLMSRSEPWVTLQRNYEKCLKSLNGDITEIYLITDNNEFIGFAALQMKGVLRGYIQTICIHPEFRNIGIGTMIIKYCEELILNISPNVFICFSSFNEDAGKLYQKLGYEKAGEFKNMIIQGHSEILLRKTIGTYNDFYK